MIPVWSTACPDWAVRLKKGLSIIPDPIYPDEAAHALAIFKQLRIVDAPGSPTFGESCARWVFDLVAALFGSYDAQTGVRHIKEVFILIPKKNSKSTLAAGIDPDALKNWSPESNQEIAATQRELIDSAFHALRPGGTLVYSTCTLNREENEAVCLWLKETYPDAVEFLPLGDLFPGANKALTEEGFLHVFPQIYDCEGFFVARLRKTQAIPVLPAPKYKVGNFPFSPVKDREAGQIRQAAASVGLNWDENLRLWQRDKELWLFPVGIEALIGKVRFSRLGIKLAETHNKGYRWQHEAVIALASPDNVNAFELTPQEAEEWYRGRDVYPHAAPVADDVLVTFQHQPIGLAKRIGSRLKNSYPRELVRDGKLFTGNA